MPSQDGLNALNAPILVTGAHRTGTTWVGKMLVASGEAAYISEPLNVLHRPGVMRSPTRYWYTYICKDNEQEILAALQETLRLEYHPWLELKSIKSQKDLLRMGRDYRTFLLGKVRHQRPLLKDPFAVFSIPWFIERLKCQVVVTVRHPAAFASSLKRLDWPFQLQDLLDQPLLMRDWLEPFRADIQALMASEQNNGAPDILSRGSLLWNMIYSVIEQVRSRYPQVLVVRHEDLSMEPSAGFSRLYNELELHYSDQAQKTIIASSSSDNPKEVSSQNAYDVRLDSRANIQNWKKRLGSVEIDRVRQITQGIASIYYPDLAW